jgi:hypothetical protein
MTYSPKSQAAIALAWLNKHDYSGFTEQAENVFYPEAPETSSEEPFEEQGLT